ncbi:hypothetical protein EDD15DRAFT_2365242 [Pisolithus albus]|nr:hypothetical protein EDD15DRAFT_2365242 [Pisolithus albus]
MPQAGKSLHKCSHCGLGFPMKSGVRWHTSHSPLCCTRWECQRAHDKVVRGANLNLNQGADEVDIDNLGDMWDAPGPQAAQVEDANDEEDDENKSTCYAYEYNKGPVADIPPDVPT